MIAIVLAAQTLIYVGAGELRKSCDPADMNAFLRCSQFVTAVNDTAFMMLPKEKKATFCIPAGTPRIALVAAFRSYYDNLPGLEEMPATAIVIAGLETSFPCRK